MSLKNAFYGYISLKQTHIFQFTFFKNSFFEKKFFIFLATPRGSEVPPKSAPRSKFKKLFGSSFFAAMIYLATKFKVSPTSTFLYRHPRSHFLAAHLLN